MPRLDDSTAALPDADRRIAPGQFAAGVWRLRLLGEMQARNGELLLTRFVSRATAALLARLALWPQRLHAREELIELLWPGVALDVGRNRLRQAISALKRLLEAPLGPDAPPLILAERQALRIDPLRLRCDVAEFELALREGRHEAARALYLGELMPGFYDDWVLEERYRLAALAEGLGPAVPPATAGAEPCRPSADAAEPLAAAPPAAGVPAPPLPAVLTRLFGRDEALAALRQRVQAHRLVTLSGPGGCGKTRLAVELLRAPPTAIDGAAFDLPAFVPLADCRSAAQMEAQLRATLQLPPPARGNAGAEAADPVAAALAGRRVLLVLDNFEQLAADAEAGERLQRWLAALPGLHLLITSRRLLGLAGEQELALAMLALPDEATGEAAGAAAALLANPAVALFIDRARAVRPDFQPSVRQLPLLAALCRALDGLPLALELAAARCRVFTIAEMQQALARRFELLQRTGPAARGRRHDSLQAAIDWSWQLLTADQQQALAALSVFRGGWSVADAEAVCGLADVRGLLESLVADSLLVFDPPVPEPETGGWAAAPPEPVPRFQMLESVRDFVTARLVPARAAALRQAHRAHVLALARAHGTAGDAPLPGPQRRNAAQALRSAVADGEPLLALELALVLRPTWDSVGLEPELLNLLDEALQRLPVAAAGTPAVAPAAAMLALLQLAAGQGERARALAEQALALAAPGSAARALALCARVRIAFEVERQTQGLAPLLDEAEALAKAADDGAALAEVIGVRGMLALRHGQDPAAAERLLAEAAERRLALGQPREAWRLRYERACCIAVQGRPEQGLAEASACEQAFALAGDRHHRLGAINLQGVLLSRRRDWAGALAAYRRCADDAWRCRNQFWLAYALWNQGRNLARLRRPEAAARLMAFSERHWTLHFGPLDPADRRFVRLVRRLVRAQIGRAAADLAWLQGQGFSLPQALSLALAQGDQAPPGANPSTPSPRV